MGYPRRSPRPLAEPTNKRLFSYALAAGAGMFAAAQPADAGVIYNNPPDMTIMNGPAIIDLDHDGTYDVFFNTLRFGGQNWDSQRLMVSAPYGGVKGGFSARFGNYANKAVPSYFVGSRGPRGGAKHFVTGPAKMAVGYRERLGTGYPWNGSAHGWWDNYTGGYLGVQFMHGLNPLYGWVRMDVSVDYLGQNISYTIRDWAYEDSGGPVHVGMIPEPGTLGLLALGSVALVAWRRRKKEQA
jgi:hypothetical protein